MLVAAVFVTSVLSHVSFGAAITTVNVSILKLLTDENGVALSGGLTGIDNDGAVIQLGYYDQSTTSNLFAGQWVPLTGVGSFNPQFNTTVGDGIPTDPSNRAIFQVSFDPDVNSHLPALTTIRLAIRIFNQTGLAALNAANPRQWFSETVSNAAWAFPAPATPPSTLSISFASNSALRLQSTGAVPVVGAPFATNTPTQNPLGVVPEPTSILLLMTGLATFASRRRRGGTN